jgi:hypothetical protein
MTEYLARESKDWNTIVSRFRANQYNRLNYSADEILNSEPEWTARYERVSFHQSIRNLVANLYLAPPPRIQREDGILPNQSGIMPPSPEVTPSGEFIISTEARWKTPSHQISWVDASTNQNERLTVYCQLLPGDINENFQVRVEDNGRTLAITYTMPDEFLNPKLLLAGRGSDYYKRGHSKIVAFKQHIKEMRGGKSDGPVTYVYKVPLIFQCEEQLSHDVEVPQAVYTNIFKEGPRDGDNKVKILAVELRGVRKNYETQHVADEIDIEGDDGMDVDVEEDETNSVQSTRRTNSAPASNSAPAGHSGGVPGHSGGRGTR